MGRRRRTGSLGALSGRQAAGRALARLATAGVVAALCMAALAAGAAAGAAGPNPPWLAPLFQEIGKPGGTLTLALGDSPQTFNYYAVLDGNAQTVLNNVFDRLFSLDPLTGELVPNLVERYEFSKDGLTLTCYLRPGIRWADGQPLTADDVVFTFEELAANTGLRANQSATLTIGGQRLRFRKVDDRTFQVLLPARYGAVLQALSFSPVLPRHKLARYDPVGKPEEFGRVWSTDWDLKDIVGTGPFMLADYRPGQKVTLVRNPYSWRRDPQGNVLPYVDRLEYVIIRDPNQQLAQFLAGQLDVLSIGGAQYPDMKRRELAGAGFKALAGRGLYGVPSTIHWAFNFDEPDDGLRELFRDLRFRQAMQAALNRQRIIDDVYNGLAALPGHGVAPGTFFWKDTTAYLGTYDLQKAAALLDEMGLRMGPDGVRRMKDGRPVRFTLTYASDSAVYPAIATILQNDLASIGVKVDLQGLPFSTVFQTALAGNFQSVLMAYGDQPDPQLRKDIWQPGTSLHYWHRSVQPAKEGQTPRLEAMFDWERQIYDLFQQAEVTDDQNVRRELYGQWQEIFAKNLDVIMVVKPGVATVAWNRVGNVFVDPRAQLILWSNMTVFQKP